MLRSTNIAIDMAIVEKHPMSWFKRQAKKQTPYTEEDMIAFAKKFLAVCQKSKVTPFQLEMYNEEKNNVKDS